MLVFHLTTTIAAVFAATAAADITTKTDDITTKTDDITTKCDDVMAGVLERLKLLEERDRQHEEIHAAQQAEIDTLTLQLHALTHHKGSRVSRELRYAAENPVAFYAKSRASQTHLHQGQMIKFDVVYTNVGGHFNNNTGIFMAPVPGVYVFSVTLMTATVTDTHAGIYVNGVMKTHLKLYGTAHEYDTMSQTAVYVLHQGDVVAIQHMEDDKAIQGDYSTFSGFLLYQDFTDLSMVG